MLRLRLVFKGGIMAYFSNGSEGAYLDEQCGECFHANDDEACCPVWAVQQNFNYDQCKKGNEDLKKAMEILINRKGICQVKLLVDTTGKVNQNKKCFQRPLVFGDEEQIIELNRYVLRFRLDCVIISYSSNVFQVWQLES